MTIDELLEAKPIGKVKLRHFSWLGDYWYIPFFQTKGGIWHGLDSYGNHASWEDDGQWELYIEPKPKKKVYEWMYLESGGKWVVSSILRTEEEAAFELWTQYKKTGREFEVEE